MHVLEQSRKLEDAVRRSEIEWQTKTLALFLSNLAATPKVAEAMYKSAEKLAMLAPDPDEDATSAAVDTSGGTDNRTLEEIMEHGNVAGALAANNRRKGPALPFMG